MGKYGKQILLEIILKMTYNIGIFGDSYTNMSSPFEEQKQWHEYLPVFVNDKCNIDNYGVAGSSLYFSYQNFKKHHEKYDKVILFYTAPNRLWMPQYSDKDINGEHIHSVDHADRRFVRGTAIQSKIRKAIKFYYGIINNPKEHLDYWELMIADIRKTRKDALVLPCFYQSENEPYWPLVYISKLDDTQYGIDIMNKAIDIRANHFNLQNSKTFGLNVSNWITSGKFLHNRQQYVADERDGLNYYYKTR